MAPVTEIDLSKPPAHFGVDSLIAVELRNMLVLQAAADISIFNLLQTPSLAALAASVAEKSRHVNAAAYTHVLGPGCILKRFLSSYEPMLGRDEEAEYPGMAQARRKEQFNCGAGHSTYFCALCFILFLIGFILGVEGSSTLGRSEFNRPHCSSMDNSIKYR